MMVRTKKRRDVEIYENYWKFTAAHLDVTGTKFNNCLSVIVRYIDINKDLLTENANNGVNFAESDLYKRLQEKVVEISEFKGKDATLSARKVINQFVKIGFIEPLLLGYHPLVKQFLLETKKEQKLIVFSKIFYENSSLASDVTIDNRNLKHVNFLLKTLDKKDIMALMVTDITNYKNGYLTRDELNSQYKFAIVNEFDERKYNQIAHLIGYLKRFVDLKYDKHAERFWFADDPEIADRDFDEEIKRDNIKHRIYKEELKSESKRIYGKAVCYLDKKAYKSLIASHIKPCIDCLREGREDEAYDVNNGLLLNPTLDSYFDKKDISFDGDGQILIGESVDESVRVDFEHYKLDKELLNERRKKYLEYHRALFNEKNGSK